MSESKVLECWREGIKVLTTTMCTHFGRPCGEVKCYFKTKEAKRLYLQDKHSGSKEKPQDAIQQSKKKIVDKGFF